MKKLTTCIFALFMTAGVAFGQNTLNVDQTGNDNSVDAISGNTATQDASAGGENIANITQAAATGGHHAFISQVSEAGDANIINLTQTFGTNSLGDAGAHTATLDQTGEGNMIDGTQNSRSHREANVLQDGNDNTATFINGADLSQTQLGDDNVANSNGGGTVVQYQEGDRNNAENQGNSAEQYQTGSDNNARSTSHVSGSATYQLQDGDWNESSFLNLRHSGNVAHSEQYGNYNDINANWNQNGNNSATIIQTSSYTAGMGDGNTANINFQSSGNLVDVVQDGMSNTVYSYQQ